MPPRRDVLKFPPKRALSLKLEVPNMGPVVALLRRDLARIVREVAEGEEPAVKARLLEAADIFGREGDE